MEETRGLLLLDRRLLVLEERRELEPQREPFRRRRLSLGERLLGLEVSRRTREIWIWERTLMKTRGCTRMSLTTR